MNPPKKFFLPKDKIQRLVPPMGGCMMTDRITVDGQKIRYMYRETTTRALDNGWRFFAGDESQTYLDDLSHTGIYELNTAANYDPDIIPYLNTPAPCAFDKIPNTNKFRPVDPPMPH